MNNNKEPTRKRIQYHTGYIFSMTMVFWLIITAFTGGLGVFLLPVFLIAFVYLAWKDKVDTDWSNNRINEDEGGHDYKGGIGYLSESKYKLGRIDPDDIKTYPTNEIPKSGRFTPEERRQEYRRRGKSPSGVIDGVYNDMHLENGTAYNDYNRDWDADA
jgi:hypothetical protein